MLFSLVNLASQPFTVLSLLLGVAASLPERATADPCVHVTREYRSGPSGRVTLGSAALGSLSTLTTTVRTAEVNEVLCYKAPQDVMTHHATYWL